MTFDLLSQSLHDADKEYPLSLLFGIVVDNNDPLLLQRVKVRVSLLHQGYDDSQLPWCLPITNLAPQGNAAGIGGCFVPANGSPVSLITTLYDPTFCYYIGGTSPVNLDPEFATNYPNVYGFRDAAGNLLKVDTVAKIWTLVLADGSYIEFNNGVFSMVTSSNFELNVKGNLAINATGTVEINGSAVNIQDGGNSAASLSTTPQTTPSLPGFSGQTQY